MRVLGIALIWSLVGGAACGPELMVGADAGTTGTVAADASDDGSTSGTHATLTGSESGQDVSTSEGSATSADSASSGEASSSSGSSGSSSSGGSSSSSGSAGSSSTAGSSGSSSSSSSAGSSSTTGASTTDFLVTVDNISDGSPLPTAFSPGVWLVHAIGSTPVFVEDAPAGIGLQVLAEDGDPQPLDASLALDPAVLAHGVFDTPVGAGGPAAILPGESYAFTITAEVPDRLSIASMFVDSNDAFIATGSVGAPLFAGNGDPLQQEIGLLALWDAGTEANQPPLGGAYQPGSGAALGVGPDESGVISRRDESTHAVPLASRIAEVDVAYDPVSEAFTLELSNISSEAGVLLSPLSPVAWAVHDQSTQIFAVGGDASATPGLESLAEDGDPTALVATLSALPGVAAAGESATGVAPGGSIFITVTPTATERFLSFATMVVWTNDAFVSTPGGVALLDDLGQPRTTSAIETDFAASLAVWDAGTEQNESCGTTGPNNGVNQVVPGAGLADADTAIRYFSDATNDFADLAALVDVTIVNGTADGELEVTIDNTSLGAPFEGVVSAVVWAVHDGGVSVFQPGVAASVELEELAEDGLTAGLDQALDDAGVLNHGVTAGPIAPGGATTFTITTDASEPVFSLWAMVAPSNDTFVSLGGSGIDLYEGASLLPDNEIAIAVANALGVWDAGTERNQAGGGGADMAGISAALDTGANEGTGLVRVANDDSSWAFPPSEQLVRVTLTPL